MPLELELAPKPLALAAAIFIGILIAAGCTSSENDAGSTTSTTVSSDSSTGGVPTDLMIQNAAEAQFTVSDDGSYQLTLTGADAEVVWFTDRPARRAGAESTADVIAEFFTAPSPDGPPNAALVWSTDGAEQIIVLTLQEGAVDADSGDVTYSVTLVETSSGGLAEFDANADVPTSPVGPVSLFIDNGYQDQVCNNTFWNALEHDLTLGDWNADTVRPPNVLFPGEWSSTWTDTAPGIDASCDGDVLYGGEDGAGFWYVFDNPSIGSSSWQLPGCANATCVVVNTRNDHILTNQIIICEPSLSQEACTAKAT